MNRLFFHCGIAVLMLTAIFTFGCSDDSNPVDTNPPADAYLWVHLDTDSISINFSDLPKIDASGEEAIQLSEFVDTLLIPLFRDRDGNAYEARELYSYQIISDDGFSASVNRGYPNNVWSHLQLGHILTTKRQVVFPDDKIDLAGAYNVKEARHIVIYRKFDVELPDSAAFVELRSCDRVQVENFDGALEDAVCLRDLASVFVANPQTVNYNVRTLDGFGPGTSMTYEQFQTGYWLVNTERTKFTDTTLVGGAYKLKVLKTIQVVQ